MYVGGAVLDLDTEGRLTEIAMWRPEQPERSEEHFPRGRQWWLVVPFYLPQSSVFWRREVFESHGMFSRDLAITCSTVSSCAGWRSPGRSWS